MCLKILLSFVCLAFMALVEEANSKNLSAPYFDAVKYIQDKGYVPQKFSVDVNNYEYSVSLFRVSSKDPNQMTKGPAFLMHGFLASSDFFLLNEEKALPFYLVDQGYDVYMGNVKGGKYFSYSQQNKFNESGFWDFSWHELAMNDLAAQLDYVKMITGNQKMQFIGHSMGTTMLLALLSKKPEYNELIDNTFLLAPMAFMGNIQSEMFTPFQNLFDNYKNFENMIGHGEFLPEGDNFQNTLQTYDSQCYVNEYKCATPEYLLTGKDPQMYEKLAQDIISNQCNGKTSVRTFIHYGQLYDSNSFREFDYGRDENIKIYGTAHPPDYKLENVKTPVVMFLGGQDQLLTRQNVDRLSEKVSGPVLDCITVDSFYHMDYLFSEDAEDEVYTYMMNYLNSKK